jgi:hypothetical protein
MQFAYGYIRQRCFFVTLFDEEIKGFIQDLLLGGWHGNRLRKIYLPLSKQYNKIEPQSRWSQCTIANNSGDLRVMLVLVASMITSPQLLTSSTKSVYSEATWGFRFLGGSLQCILHKSAIGKLALAVRASPEITGSHYSEILCIE